MKEWPEWWWKRVQTEPSSIESSPIIKCVFVCVGLRERHCVWCRMCRICVCLRKSASPMSQLQLSSMNVHDNTQEHAGVCRGVQAVDILLSHQIFLDPTTKFGVAPRILNCSH